MAKKAKKRSGGPTQPEDERTAQQKMLRLTHDEIKELDALARAAGLSASRYVAKELHLSSDPKK